jgi:Protein of unknown function (DUF2950)
MAEVRGSKFRFEMRKVSRMIALGVVCGFVALAAGCSGKSSAPSIPATPQLFSSWDAAGQALYNAAKAHDTNALLTVFGSNAQQLVLSGDPNDDKVNQDRFVASYDLMHRWDKLVDGNYVLTIGASNYPLPFPLTKNSSGQWYFDGEDAKNEIQARRVGENEMRAMDTLYAMADAQDEYHDNLHDDSAVQQYAQKFSSSAGKHDGLYWKAGEGEAESPLGPLAAAAAADGHSGNPNDPYHGYFYRILTAQGDEANGGALNYVVDGAMTGGYAILAWPAEYANSGVMTFTITSDGAIYQKDLGSDTANAVKSIDKLNLDPGWKLLE